MLPDKLLRANLPSREHDGPLIALASRPSSHISIAVSFSLISVFIWHTQLALALFLHAPARRTLRNAVALVAQ